MVGQGLGFVFLCLVLGVLVIRAQCAKARALRPDMEIHVGGRQRDYPVTAQDPAQERALL